MTESNSAEKTHRSDASGGNSDDDAGTVSRSMSLPEIQEAVSTHIDEMDGSSWFNRLLTARYRRGLFERAESRVLDVACGTATNRAYLPDTTEYVGVDLSPAMLSRAAERFDDLERDETLLEMDAENLEFDDDSFDTVISSMSTCMFPDPVAALDEMARVCKPDGTILLLEHGRSSVGIVARFQDRRADDHYRSKGCHWNQEPLAHVDASTLSVRESSTHLLGIITSIEAEPA